MSSVIWTLLGVVVLGWVYAVNDGSRWIPRQLRERMWHDGGMIAATALCLAGVLLLFQEPWHLSPAPMQEVVKLHGRQAVGAGLMNFIITIGPFGAGVALLGAAWWAYRAARV